ncbi:MarR family winged helix-turn-helix transcriptional regulator [Leifsonia sp. Leaf336]|uniref:MarR family winged helix-turn-helix transcriptional regulator n=1 Tax=Leifsonia sp. Leaf336 TaxID=1736341 RepID=UPI000AA8C656|nr:MarR family winged helix-turn-helix transcriptional regulator [Leifsonia sp. Leaf336]
MARRDVSFSEEPGGEDLPVMSGQAGHWVRRAHQVHNALWVSTVSGAVTPSQFAVLSVLAESPDVDQNAISRGTSLDTSTTGAIVNRLAQRGLLEMRKDPSDLRRNLLRLSPQGEQEFRELAHKAAHMTDAYTDALDESERHQLVSLLKRLVETGESS